MEESPLFDDRFEKRASHFLTAFVHNIHPFYWDRMPQ